MNPQAPQLQIAIDKTTGVVCSKCQSTIFEEKLMLRKASKFLTGSPNDMIVPLNVLVCSDCKTLNLEIMPPELRVVLEKENSLTEEDHSNVIKGNFKPSEEVPERG